MAAPSSLFQALDLATSPILVGVMRGHPVPDDVLTLIKIAGGDEESIASATRVTGRQPSQLQAAAIFYIRQVLWAGNADHYRLLGAAQDDDSRKLAEHMRWLMRWLHPDLQTDRRNKPAAARVLEAWDTLKTPQRRREYDRKILGRSSHHAKAGGQRSGLRRLPLIETRQPAKRGGNIWFWASALAVVVLLIVAVMMPERILQPVAGQTPSGFPPGAAAAFGSVE